MKLYKRVALSFLLCAFASYAQQEVPMVNNDSVKVNREKENLLSVNPISFVWGTASVTYERRVAEKWALGLTFNYRPENKAPFKNTLQKIFENEDADGKTGFDIEQLKYSGVSFAPEVKFYLGQQAMFKGVYIAAFAKFEAIKMSYMYRFEELILIQRESEFPLEGKSNAFSGGVYIGVKWNLGKDFYLDWQIIGGNYGSANIDVSASRTLSSEEQRALYVFAEDLKENFKNIDYNINSEGIEIKGRIPWFGLRTGVSVAYRF